MVEPSRGGCQYPIPLSAGVGDWRALVWCAYGPRPDHRHRLSSMPEEANFDPYAVLNVRPDADVRAIRAAYRALARRHHPDIVGHDQPSEQMVTLNRAWEILRNETSRAEVDRRLGIRERLERRRFQGEGRAPGAGEAP